MNVIIVMLFAVLLWGTHGIFVSLTGAAMGTVMVWRMGLASISMMFVVGSTGRISQFAKMRPTLRTVLSSLAWTLNSALFVAAIAAGGSVDAVVCLVYSYPVYTVIIRAIRGKTLQRADFLSVAWGIVGVVAMVVNGWQADAALPLVLAAISGFGLALHLEVNEEALTREETEFSLIMAMLIGLAVIVSLAGFGAVKISLPQSSGQFLCLSVLGLVTGITYALYAYASHKPDAEGNRLSSVTTGQILLLEILVAAVLDWIVLGSEMTLLKLVGGLCIVWALWIQIHKEKD